MYEATTCLADPNPPPTKENLQALQARVLAEFREMPCLRLTLPQAARLFGIDTESCERVLGSLVEHGVLVFDRRMFARSERLI